MAKERTQPLTMRVAETGPEPLRLVWVDCSYPVAATGLARILEEEAEVHVSRRPPEREPSIVVLSAGGPEGLLEGIERIRIQRSDVPIIVFSLHLDLEVALVAIRAGARGFIHAGMQPKQISRAIKVALEGEMVAPRQLLEYLISAEDVVDLNILSARQREILELVCEGLTNAQVAKRIFLTESTVKQHLRSAYKLLGVSNRTEAAKLMRNVD